MKILVIPDLHWLDYWEQFAEGADEFDRIVFLGDYVDSYVFDDNTIIKNLREIIAFKKEYPDKVVLLLGNHDIQYIWKGNNCSWRRESYALVLETIFKENLDLFKVFHEEWGYLFSHAGISEGWIEQNKDILENYFSELYTDSYEHFNMLLNTHDKDILFQVWSHRGGRNTYGWPLWADSHETCRSNTGLTQVVWHTRMDRIGKYPTIIYCDTWENSYDNRTDFEPLILEYEK